jgi:hypothetical protein
MGPPFPKNPGAFLDRSAAGGWRRRGFPEIPGNLLGELGSGTGLPPEPGRNSATNAISWVPRGVAAWWPSPRTRAPLSARFPGIREPGWRILRNLHVRGAPRRWVGRAKYRRAEGRPVTARPEARGCPGKRFPAGSFPSTRVRVRDSRATSLSPGTQQRMLGHWQSVPRPVHSVSSPRTGRGTARKRD